MKLHINANERLTVVKGSVVYELPLNGIDALNVIAIRNMPARTCAEQYAQQAVNALLNAACSSCKVGNRAELEAVDSPIMRVSSTGGHARVNTRSYL